jgi:hypothetical protein
VIEPKTGKYILSPKTSTINHRDIHTIETTYAVQHPSQIIISEDKLTFMDLRHYLTWLEDQPRELKFLKLRNRFMGIYKLSKEGFIRE